MTGSRLCLIGDVIVDVTMTAPVKMRLGGIFHAARTCWALGVPFDLLYIAPEYLVEDTEDYAHALGAMSVRRIGAVAGAPNVVVVKDATEAGPQGYEYLLREKYRCELGSDIAQKIPQVSDLIVFPGSYDLKAVLQACQGKGDLAVDIANWGGSVEELAGLEISTAICSASSSLFVDQFGGNVEALTGACLAFAKKVLFKENRGGSRLFEGSEVMQFGAQLRPIAHSVGVGDSFNVAFLARCRLSHPLVAGNFAARVAAEYAATTYPDEFKLGVKTVSSISDEVLSGKQGVSLPWEKRSALNVYIAAPDFDYNDRSHIDAVANALAYHNLKPRLPVRENGQAATDDERAKKLILFDGDMRLLTECQLLVAVVIDSDPGTLIELGLAAGMGMATVVYDPHGLAENVMLSCLPDSVCRSLDEVVSAVFTHLSRRGEQ